MPAGIIATIGNEQYQIGGPSNVEKQEFDAIFRLNAEFELQEEYVPSSFVIGYVPGGESLDSDEDDLPELLNLDTNLSVVTGNLDDCINKLSNGEIINAVFYIDAIFYRTSDGGTAEVLNRRRINTGCEMAYVGIDDNEVGMNIFFQNLMVVPAIQRTATFSIKWFPNDYVTVVPAFTVPGVNMDNIEETLVYLYEEGFFSLNSIDAPIDAPDNIGPK